MSTTPPLLRIGGRGAEAGGQKRVVGRKDLRSVGRGDAGSQGGLSTLYGQLIGHVTL